MHHSRILATVPKMVESFSRLYPISKIRQNTAGLSLGPAIGRYPEDTYDGTGSSRGNPWFVCTVGLAEYYYRLISLYRNKGSVTVNTLNLVFFNFLGIWNVEPDNTYGSETPQFETIVNTLSVRGDEILRRVQYHSMDGAMSEQFNRIYGFMQGATNVTWTYASLLSANRARLRA